MRKRIISMMVLLGMLSSVILPVSAAYEEPEVVELYSEQVICKVRESNTPTYEVQTIERKSPEVLDIYYELESDPHLAEERFYDDLELLAVLVMAEAEGESEYGKRLVIDTVLNRMDHPTKFENDISSVIYEKGQFTSMTNGRSDRVSINEEVCRLVSEELENRTDYNVLYFTAGGYGKYGTHYKKEGNHYFCK